MKNMKLSTKIGLGFGILIIIAVALGSLAVWKMTEAGDQSERMQVAYVPEVEVGNQIERTSLLTMYAMRGYGYTEEERFLKSGREQMKEIFAALDKARTLGSEQDLEKLTDYEAQATAKVKEYEELAERTVVLNNKLAELRQQMDVSGAAYMENCADFLNGQDKKFDEELHQREQQLLIAQEVVRLGTQGRVNNFKGQATNDTELLVTAADGLDEIYKKLTELRKYSTSEEALSMIQATEKSTQGYQAAIRTFEQEFSKGSAANHAFLEQGRKKMDANAAQFVENCEAFLNRANKKLESDITERKLKMKLANDIIDVGNFVRVNNFKSQALRDPGTMREALAKFADMTELFDELRKYTRLEVDLQRIDGTQKAAKGYQAAMTQFLDTWLEREDLNRQRTVVGEEVLELAQKTAEAGMNEVKTLATTSRESLAAASLIMIVGLIVAIIAGIGIAVFITMGITKAIKVIISGLTDASSQVASAAGQVSQASQSLAEGASEQAAGIEETSSSLEELTSMTHQNAQNASSANEIMTETSRIVDEANHSMVELSKQMEEISDASEETQKIIKTIDEIAFQTNLLALNAAVEAARAGEAGAGFAVVADEVRNLAMRAAEAAKNTSALIEGSVDKITNGTNLMRRTNDAFKKVEDSARKAGGLVNEIASASKEQATGLDQINKAVAEMDKVTQQNASGAEESASAAEEMSAQSEQLREYVGDLVAMVDGSSAKIESHAVQVQRQQNKPKMQHQPARQPAKAAAGHGADDSGFWVKGSEDSSEIPMPSSGNRKDFDFTDEH